ncbi:MAG: hypothetical protein Q9201_002006 [Fulgogasparrea decipioides]
MSRSGSVGVTTNEISSGRLAGFKIGKESDLEGFSFEELEAQRTLDSKRPLDRINVKTEFKIFLYSIIQSLALRDSSYGFLFSYLQERYMLLTALQLHKVLIRAASIPDTRKMSRLDLALQIWDKEV